MLATSSSPREKGEKDAEWHQSSKNDREFGQLSGANSQKRGRASKNA